MNEIEIKILDIHRATVEEKLRSLGAEKTFDDEIHAFYFDFADGSIRKRKGVLRLRREGPRAVVTYKKDVDSAEAKVREEKEVAVADFAAMKEIFQSMGLSPWLEMKKHRTTFEIGAVHFEFDKYHGNYEYIPEFIEIEGPDTETVYRYAEKLGFGRKDCRPWDALEVAEHYSSRRNG